MALLREFVTLDYDKALIKEAKEKGEPVVLKKALLQRADAPNQNNRVYKKAILEREIDRYMKVVKENRALGELDHPSDSVVNLKNVSHVIRDVWWSGNEVFGSVEILPTNAGKIVRDLIESNITLGISSRGIGDTIRDEMTGYDAVDESFQLICFDLVSEPSTVNAFLFESKGIQVPVDNRLFKVNSILDSILKKQ
jgi:hypothetical protein